MTRCKLLVGIAALSVLVSGFGAAAQDAATPQAAQPEAAPAPQQQAAQDCSGLGCLFGARPQAQPETQSETQPAPQPADPVAQAPVAQAGVAQAAEDPVTPTDPVKSAPKKVAKPVHVVTIAAEAPEMPRLQRLAAALPKEKIKIVKSKADGDTSGSDFSVSTALDGNQARETTKLFTEQMHIVAGAGVLSVEDLQGKVVSFGPDKSPSQAAARKAFEALNIQVTETPLDIDNALDGLSTGDLAAVVLLAPQPIDRLKSVSSPGVHLVSWPAGGALPIGATAATIDAGVYPSLIEPGETIHAMGVDATLTISAKGSKQVAAKTFLKALAQHSDALTKRGFDLLKADLESRNGRRLASAEHL